MEKIPPGAQIGESWEIVDRPEAQSVVARGPLKGKSLHELWTEDRSSIFGEVPDTPRFPLLIKLLDANEKLSLQVHPPEQFAGKLGGEPKTEFWYVAAADLRAEVSLGFRKPIKRDQFETALREGTAADYVHQISVKPGDAAFLPAGRLHAVSAGNLLIEIQQNSDTTYRVFDWNRIDSTSGKPRELHLEQALQCINFNDVRPKMVEPRDQLLIRHALFEIQNGISIRCARSHHSGNSQSFAVSQGSLPAPMSILRVGSGQALRRENFSGTGSVAGSTSETTRRANKPIACDDS